MHPTVELFGGITLPSYGLLLGLGFLCGLAVVRRLAPRAGLEPARVLELCGALVLGGILGSRVVYVSFYTDAPLWEALFFWRPGQVWHGGLLGGVAVLAYYRLRHRMPLCDLGDVCMPAACLAHVFGRVGCFAAGCCFGKPSAVPWAVTFPEHGYCALPGVPLHPTQLYEAGSELLLFALLMRLWHRRRYRGQIFLSYFLVYAPVRFVLELLRGDSLPVTEALASLTTAQAVSVLLFVSAIVCHWRGWPRSDS